MGSPCSTPPPRPASARWPDAPTAGWPNLLDGEIARWRAVDPMLAEPLRALEALVVAGGKRLRPAFCHWAFVGAGGDPDDLRVVDAGASLEMLHAFALVHDDVMDGADTRRGRRTAHLAFADEHAAGHWRGEARRFGEGAPSSSATSPTCTPTSSWATCPPTWPTVWHELRLELNIGQYLDLAGTGRGRPRPGAGRPHRPLQVRQVHDRAAAARGAALAGPGRPGGPAVGLRRPAGRGVPAARRRARRLRGPGPHRQARGPGPAGGQAHPAAGRGGRAGRG